MFYTVIKSFLRTKSGHPDLLYLAGPPLQTASGAEGVTLCHGEAGSAAAEGASGEDADCVGAVNSGSFDVGVPPASAKDLSWGS